MPMNKVPTLLIGLGGIGCSIADMAHSMLNDEIREYVGVIGVDTNVEDLKKLKIKSVRTSDERRVKDFLIEHPEYQEWFPVNKFTVNRGMLTGAGQVRSISRLAALASIESGKFIVLEEEIKRILKHTGDKDNTAFNVFVVGSITGGTGAGLFLQMPFYIRHLLRQEYAIDNIRIRGMFVSADITKNLQPSKTNRDAVMVNAYTCMKELNAFYLTQNMNDDENMLSIEFYEKSDRQDEKHAIKDKLLKSKTQSEFGMEDFFDDGFDLEAMKEDIESISSEGANIPYDAFYLIEGTDNTGGIGNASIDTVKKQIAKMIYTLLFTPVKAEDAGITDNFVLKDMQCGGMNRYSSAGMCSLKYPYEQVKEYVTLRWVKDLVSQEWLILDKMYEQEKKEAQDRQKSDPATKIPEIEEAYVRLFNKESGGGEGKRLGQLRMEAYTETGSRADALICNSAFILRRIDEQINMIMAGDDISIAAKECQCNMKLLSDMDVADKEISRVYDELERLRKTILNVVEQSRYEVANEVFPVSKDSLNMRKDSELCIYKSFANVHPVTARFLCYSVLLQLDQEIRTLESVLAGMDLLEYERVDFYGKADDGIQNASEAVIMLRNNRMPFGLNSKKNMRVLSSKFQQMSSAQVQTLLEYGTTMLRLSTYRMLKERFNKMAEYYQKFFEGIQQKVKQNEVRINILEKSFLSDGFGETYVYASPEALRRIYGDFKLKAAFEIPKDSKKAILESIFVEVCASVEDKNRDLTELQKQKQKEGVEKRLDALFETGIVDILRTHVTSEGRGTVNLNIKEAIGKELQLKTGISENYDEEYEKKRVEYESELILGAMKKAAPMFAVQNVKDITETIYMAIHPDTAEQNAGVPDKGATKDKLALTPCEQTDNQPVNILMEKEFSKYEIVCFKAKHNFEIENLTKYSKSSEYAKAYETRINQLGKEPTEDGEDAYMTVVNPHLNRFWHEEGFVPSIGVKEREKISQEVLKAFIYAMGMDSFVKEREEQFDNREIWSLRIGVGAQILPVRKQGRLIGNGYVDLLDSLNFNRKVRKYIISQSKIMMKGIKGYLDADEMLDMIQSTWFIEELIQSEKQPGDEADENILDILLNMYPKMDKKKWEKLFDGLQLVLFEYLEYMFDGNAQLINKAYTKILNWMFAYSIVGKKEIERRRLLEAGADIPAELELSPAEKKVKLQIDALSEKKYM